jgi:CHAT domain-containing protein
VPAKKNLTSWPACIAAASAACVTPWVSAVAAPAPDCYSVLASLPAALESVATLHGKEQHRWDVQLPANASVVVSVVEDGLDLVLEVARDGDGRVAGRAESPLERRGTQRVVFVTNEARGYVINVAGKDHADATGSASVRVTVASGQAMSSCFAGLRELAAGDAKFAAGQRAAEAPRGPAGANAAQEYEAAATAYGNAATLLKDSAPSLLLAQAQLARAATFNQSLQDWGRAKAAATDAALSHEKAADPYGQARARLIEAEARMELAALRPKADGERATSDELAKVRATLDDIARFHAKRGEKYDEAIALNDSGIAFYQEGRFDDALRLFRRTVPLYGGLQEKPRQAQVLQNIAAVEYELGRLSEAIPHYREAMSLMRREDDPAIFATLINNSGMAKWATGDHDGALRELGEALSSAEQVHDTYQRAVILHNMGRVYDSLGDQDRALDFYQQALQLRAAESDPSRRVASLRAIGNILRERGKLDEALKMHRDALALTTAPSARARVLLQVARDLGERGQVPEALQQLDPILKPAGIGDEVTHARALAIRGQYSPLSSTTAQRDLYNAIATFQRYESPVDEFDTWLVLARSMRARGRLDAAMAAVDKALTLAEEVRLQSANPELRAALMQPLQPAFDLKISMLAAQYAAPASKPAAREALARLALATAERSRSRALQDFQTLDVSAPDVPPELVQQRRTIYRELAARRFSLAANIDRKGTDDIHVRTISADIAQLRRQLDEIDARIGAASGKASHRPHSGKRGTLDESVLPDDTAVVEYWLGQEGAFAWVITRNAVVMTRLGATAAITDSARVFYEALRNFGSVPEDRRLDSGARLHALIVQPLAQQALAKRRLVFVADGALHYIPFAALRTAGGPSGKFLIETHDISTAPSLDLLLNRPATVLTGNTPRQMLVVADPVYGLDDLRLGAHAERPKEEGTSRWPFSLLTRSAQGEGYLARLPGSAREAVTIASVFPAGSVDRLEGFTATRDRFLNAGLGRYQFIHIATHAVADSDVPQASALLLSRFDSRSQEIDGRVLAADFINVQLNAQTVVLSACDTAMGKNISGEGLMGLRYVVLARGARAVVASMWPVADQVSADLMADFYKTLLQDQRRVAPALSNAMRTAIKGRFKDPGLWAAYGLTVSDLDGT